MSELIMTKSEKTQESVVLEVLGHAYEQVFLVDKETGKAEKLLSENLTEEEKEAYFIADMDEWLEQYFETCYAGDDLGGIHKKTKLSVMLEVLGDNKPYVMEYSIAEGKRIRRKRMSAVKPEEEGSFFYLCIQDITEQYEQQQRNDWLITSSIRLAEKANGLKLEFLQKLSQNIRTPLYGIKGYLQEIAAMDESGDIRKEYIEKANGCVEEFAKQFGELLDMAACENHELALKEDVLMVDDFLKEVEQLFTPYAKEKNMSFSICRLTPEVGMIVADRRRWQQIFEQLLMNAFQYGEESGKVVVTLSFEKIQLSDDEEEEIDLELELNQVVKENARQSREQYMSVITFENTGLGPEKDEIHKFFEEFYTTRPEGHMGMGIPMVRNLVDYMGGSMEFRTSGGQGVTVEIRIPAKKPGRLQQEQAQQLTHMLPKIHERDFSYCRALVVDDNETNSEITKLKLQRMGLMVEQAWDGEEALEKILNSPINYYQIVFMNPLLPNKTGLSATLEIREHKRRDISNIVIVALTAHPLRDERIRALEHGMDYHLPLPLDDIELNEILVRELRGIEQEKEYGVLGFRIVK